MNKKLMIYAILSIALVISVIAVGSVNIQETAVSVSANPGSINNTQTITVENTGTTDLSGMKIVKRPWRKSC